MTIQINMGDHVSSLSPLFLPVPFRHQWVTSWARQRAKHIAATMPSALATLIHELTHSNGAPGEGSKAAEEALLHCGLGKRSERTSGKDDPRTPFDPSAVG